MRLAELSPDAIDVDPMNERAETVTAEDVSDLAESIERTGVVQPPIVREGEAGQAGHAVTVGQRRVLAAREAGVESIPVIVAEYDDRDALRASISENADLFRRAVSVKDRAEALDRYWQLLGGSGMPTPSHLASELGVPRQTVRDWLEPMAGAWEDTVLSPEMREFIDDYDLGDDTDDETGSGSDSGTRELADVVGTSTMADIRRITGGGEDGERLARLVADGVLTRSDIRSIKEDVESGTPLSDAIAEARRDRVEVTVRFDAEVSRAIENYADRTGEEREGVVESGVRWFLDAEGAFDPPEPGNSTADSEPSTSDRPPPTERPADQPATTLADEL